MSPYSTNPLLHEYTLIKELGISPDKLEDEEIIFPSFKEVFMWLFGKPLKVVKRGIDAKKIDMMLTIIDQEHLIEQEQVENLKKDFK